MITFTNEIAVIIVFLAIYRLSNALADVTQSGPYDILHRVRHLAGVRPNDRNEFVATTNFSDGLLCVYCNSVWLGLVALMVMVVNLDVAALLSLPFAASGFVVIVTEALNG